MEKLIGRIHSTENFGTVDGPGIRFVIFMQGCKMRCKFCHNPDTWNLADGKEVTAQELIDQALRFRAYWGEDGGITVTGGEPLLQIDFLIELFTLAKKEGINTTLDTCGQPFTDDAKFLEKFDKLLEITDLILLDIKHIDSKEHKKLTMHANENILRMAKYLSDKKQPVWIRHVLIPTITDDDEYLEKLAQFLGSLNNIRHLEVLPYHTMGVFKWEAMGLKYPLEGIESPSTERVENAKNILNKYISFMK